MEKSIDDIMNQFKQIESENGTSGGGVEKSTGIFSSFPTMSTKNGLRIMFLLFVLFLWGAVLLMIFRPNRITDEEDKIVWKHLFLYNSLLLVSLLFMIGIGVYIAIRFIK
jgi:hypothetical protein